MSQDPVTTAYKDLVEAQRDARAEAHRISPELRSNESTSKDRSLISREEAMQMTSLSYSQLVYLEKLGQFPSGYKIGKRKVAYLKREVEAWIDSKLLTASEASRVSLCEEQSSNSL